MTDQTDRRAELIAAAATGDLTVFERSELSALRRSDPSVDAEIAELSSLIGGLRALGERSAADGEPLWDASLPEASDALGDRVRALAHSGADGSTDAGGVDGQLGRHLARPRRRRLSRRLIVAASVIGCLVLGFGAGVAFSSATLPGTSTPLAGPSATPTGPPGTLGAIETVRFGSEPAGVTVTGALVAHTWGTEALLEIEGLPADESYAVVMVGRDGSRTDTGTFLGSTKTIDCQMNAAVLRQNVGAIEITDAAGAVVAEADVPVVS